MPPVPQRAGATRIFSCSVICRSSPAYRSHHQGSESTPRIVEWRCAASASRSARFGTFPTGKGRQRTTDCFRCSLTPQAIRNVGHRYQSGGLERALNEKQRPGAAEVLDDSQKQRLIAMVCSSPPQGRARWTVRLVAEEAVKRRLVPRVGRETIRILLLSHDWKPWREKNVGGGRS